MKHGDVWLRLSKKMITVFVLFFIIYEASKAAYIKAKDNWNMHAPRKVKLWIYNEKNKNFRVFGKLA